MGHTHCLEFFLSPMGDMQVSSAEPECYSPSKKQNVSTSLLIGALLSSCPELPFPLTPMTSSLISLLSPFSKSLINKTKTRKGNCVCWGEVVCLSSHSSCWIPQDSNTHTIRDEVYPNLFLNENYNFSCLKYFTSNLTLVEANHALLFLK